MTNNKHLTGPWHINGPMGDRRLFKDGLNGGWTIARYVDKDHEAILKASPDMLKALEGVLHHNDAVKEAHKLPNSLIREIVAAIAKAKGYPADGVRGEVLPIN